MRRSENIARRKIATCKLLFLSIFILTKVTVMEGTLAEIRMFAGNFSPRGWAFCSGQILPIAQNTAVFSLLGTTFGGNGTTNFALPDLRGRVPVGTGQGPALPNYSLGQVGGVENVSLLLSNLPAHTHTATLSMGARNGAGNSISPTGNYPANVNNGYSNTQDAQMAALNGSATVGNTGGSQPFSIMTPYLGLNYIICLEGIFPSRN
jgi:microcystin-dependent protein